MKEGKVFKRILAIALVVVMTITMMPFGVFAEGETPCTHNTGEHTVIQRVEPTCTEDGHYRYYQCKCGVYFNRRDEATNQLTEVITDPTTFGVIPNLGGHKGGTATCAKKAVCTVCNEEYGEKLDTHSYDDGEVTTAAKCGVEGVKTYTCTVEGCGNTKTEKIDALEHILVDVNKQDSTCKEAGYEAYKKCDREGCTYTEGYKAIPVKSHDVEGVEFTKYDDEYHTKKCKACGVDTTYVKHTFGEAVETKAPSCEGKGEMTSTCVCGAEKKTDIPATGHNWKAGWCDKCGTNCEHDWDGNKCKICKYTCVNHQYDDANCQNEAICYICHNKVADKNPNKHVTEETYKKNEKEAKCYEPGYTGDEYYVCCNGLKKAGKEITVDHVYATTLSKKDDATHGKKCTNAGCSAFEASSVAEHKYEIFEEIKPATCTEKGKAIFKCKDCGAVSEGELDKVPHQFATEVTDKGDGTHGKKCANCDAFDAVANHDWKFESAKTPATCTEDGVGNYKCNDCGATKEDKINKLNHDTTGVTFEKVDADKHGKKCKVCLVIVEEAEHTYAETNNKTNPTCVTAGKVEMKCAACGDTYDKVLEADTTNGHSWNEWTVTTKPTCTEKGVRERTCKFKLDGQQAHKETEDIDPTGHTLAKVAKVDATCQADGNNEYYKCSVCSAAFKDAEGKTATTVEAEKIAKGEHSFTNYVYNVNSETCTSDGTETAKCDNCDETHTRYVVGTQVAHLFKNYVADGNATCIADGTKSAVCETCKEARDTVDDKGSKDTAPHKPDNTGKKCELCNAELVCTHTYSQEKLITKTPTCTEAGQKAIVCSKCKANKPGSEEVLAATGHAWDEGEVIKAATCKEKGSMKHKCNNMCGETKTEEIAVVPHNYKEEITHATCTEDGYSTFTCTMCGSHYVDKPVEAYGHMFDIYFYDEGSATCYQDGTKTAECANGCGTKNTIADPGSKTDHEMTDFTVIKAATCTEDGEEEAKCFYYDKCGYSELVPVDALGHDIPADFVTVTEPTCTEKGLKTKTCTRCPETVATEEIPALGHDIAAEYTVDVAPTCTTTGKQSKHCSRCDYKDSEEEIPATGHDYKPGEGTTATCTEPGKAVYVCTVCGDSYSEDSVPALGHDFDYVSDGNATCTADGTKTGKCIRCDATSTVADEGSKLEHVLETTVEKASTEKAGLKITKCANCEYEESEEIAKIESLKLKYEVVAYDGKYKRPSLTITDADGKKLVKGEDYILDLPAKDECINAGTYTYTVYFQGDYEGEE
ncbi:MAG: hypothetical protein IJ962_01105, partial [Clostridia bacterium]|nr:hypothetical protein [Clostridia bacterium]